MGERNPIDEEQAGQNGASLDDMPHFPATVHDHTEREHGVTLHTRGDTGDTDIEVYDGDQPAHRSGNPPEGS